ncbi:hypothetical protein ACWCOV_19495 [Kribbella sp. NPDC002412]
MSLVRWWVRERHRHERVLRIVPGLPLGSVYVDEDVHGVRAEIGSRREPVAG